MNTTSNKFSFTEVKEELRALRITITRTTAGEFRVNHCEGKEETAYYTDDLDDARDTGLHMAHDKPRETNVEFLTRVMEFAKSGPLMQGFIMDALLKGAERVTSNEAEVLKLLKDSFVSGPAWIACARELRDEINAR
jgi:hypothetical protein